MRISTRLTAATLLLVQTGAALAHGSHGLQGEHWHASDTAGFIVLVVLATAALWLSRTGE